MYATPNLVASCEGIVECVSKIVAISAESSPLPDGIIEGLMDLAAVAGAIAINEKKDSDPRIESFRRLGPSATKPVHRDAREEKSEQLRDDIRRAFGNCKPTAAVVQRFVNQIN